MKKYLSLLLIVLLGAFTVSCDSDDDGDSGSLDPVVGSWRVDQVNFIIEEDNVTVFDETFSTDTCNSPIFFTFVNGGQLTTSDFELDFDFDFNGNISLDCIVEGNNLNGGWEFINGNIYFIIIDGESQEVQINFSNNDNTFDLIIINNVEVNVKDTVILTGNRV